MGSDHYFSAAPAGAANLRRIRATLADRDVEVTTAGGVFSPEHVDSGTQVLLANTPPPPPGGNLLDLGSGWGINAHYGMLKFKNVTDGDYNDWKLGVTKDIGGYVFGASYVDTDAKGDCGVGQFYCFTNGIGTKTKDAGRSTVVLSVSKSF